MCTCKMSFPLQFLLLGLMVVSTQETTTTTPVSTCRTASTSTTTTTTTSTTTTTTTTTTVTTTATTTTKIAKTMKTFRKPKAGLLRRPGFRLGCLKSCYGVYDGEYHSCHGCRFVATCYHGNLYLRECYPAGYEFDAYRRSCAFSSNTCTAPFSFDFFPAWTRNIKFWN